MTSALMLRLAGVVGRADTGRVAPRPGIRGGSGVVGAAGVVGGVGVVVRAGGCGGGDAGLAVRATVVTLALPRPRGGGFRLVDGCLAGGGGLAAVRDLGGLSGSVLGERRRELGLGGAGHAEAVRDARWVGEAGRGVGLGC